MSHTEQDSSRPVIRYAAFSLGGLLRFLSHQELVDVFGHALLRSDVAVAYSQGFNPHLRLSLPAPKAVGMSCDADIVRMELTRSVGLEEFRCRLARQLPEGLVITRVWDSAVRKYPQIRTVILEIDLERWAISDLAVRVEEFLKSEHLIVKRKSHKSGRERDIDVRSFVDRLELSGQSVIVELQVSPDGSVRPGELLAALGLPATEGLSRITRTQIHWTDETFLADIEAA